MQAILLAGGKGTRMMPLTQNTPKPLLKLGNKTILDSTIQNLPDEVTELIIIIGYLKDQIVHHVTAHYPDKKVIFVDEPTVSGTAFAVTACKQHMKGNFLVLNGDDIYSKSDLSKLVGQDWAMLVKHEEKTKRFGLMQIDSEMNVTGHQIVSEDVPGFVNIGAYSLGMDYFDYEMKKIKSGEYGLPQTIFGAIEQGKKVKAIVAEKWFPIGYPEDLPKAEEYLKNA